MAAPFSDVVDRVVVREEIVFHRRWEPILLAVVARFCVRVLSWRRALAVFDRLPVRDGVGGEIVMPPERFFRGAGACLARTLARSQYLRRRGVPTTIVIGATGTTGKSFSLDAHAWLERFDDSPRHGVLQRIER